MNDQKIPETGQTDSTDILEAHPYELPDGGWGIVLNEGVQGTPGDRIQIPELEEDYRRDFKDWFIVLSECIETTDKKDKEVWRAKGAMCL